jgi:hypothetical protein
MLERRRSYASYIYISIEKSGVLSAPGKEGEAVDGNRCSILSKSLDLNKVYASRVGILIVGISESKLWPKSSSR